MKRNRQKRTRETITVEEAAEIVGCSRDHIYKLIHNKTLPTVQAVRPFRIVESKFRQILGLAKVTNE